MTDQPTRAQLEAILTIKMNALREAARVADPPDACFSGDAFNEFLEAAGNLAAYHWANQDTTISMIELLEHAAFANRAVPELMEGMSNPADNIEQDVARLLGILEEWYHTLVPGADNA